MKWQECIPVECVPSAAAAVSGVGELSIQGWGLSVQGGHVCVTKGVRLSGGFQGRSARLTA